MTQLSDEEYVARVEGGIAHWRARNRAWMDACEKIALDQAHPDVTVRFDENGDLTVFEVDDDALHKYTNTELEQIMTDALRQTRAQFADQVRNLYAEYLSPGDPRFKPDVLGVPYVELPD
ncbi:MULTISPECIES: type I secretion protein TolC [Mycobacteriaceae]|uniref:type I secretion protein TolC n=1 Tax=Mycobacteriaceae TaxID=1762 RepID=UPI001CDA0526|nr:MULTISPECIES: type I secretion protein TolC [unclassified Mycobacterium]MCA2244884.1 type I secretion protein TolC [Mycobacterium sp. WUMAC-067]MCA2316259.1 type I secretion protein TolC [Mycobacterium sp. WUMAC-025]